MAESGCCRSGALECSAIRGIDDFRSREVEYILRFSESRAFVCPAPFKGFDYVRMIQELRPGLQDLKAICVLGSSGHGVVLLDDIVYGSDATAPLTGPPPGPPP
jgi:non-ribosomal peptide synthetase component E (peptide arylation enzyme)